MAKRDRSTGRNMIGDLSDPALISTLAGWLESSGAKELEITTPDGGVLKIALGTGARPAMVAEPAPVIPTARSKGRVVRAPMAGFFRDSHPVASEAGPLVGEGRALEAGTTIGFVEVGPILLPVTAPDAGVIEDIHAHAGEVIGYGDAILTMEPSR